MSAIFTIRNIVLGLVSWAVPFVAAFAFYDRSGQLLVPQPLFKSLMMVIFGGLGTALLVVAFRRTPASLRSGLALGGLWLAINLLPDLGVLVPFTKMPVVTYLYDIGLRYLLIPIMAAGLGSVGSRSALSAAGR